jgi:hypothetical protein
MVFAHEDNVQGLVGPLTKSELLALLPPNTFSTSQTRTWHVLLDAVALLPENLKTAIRDGRNAKDNVQKISRRLKRKRLNMLRHLERLVWRRLHCACHM